MKTSILILLFALFGLSEIYAQDLSPTWNDGYSGKDGYGYKNSSGKLVIPYRYESAGYFSEGLAYVGKRVTIDEYIYSYIDENGNEVIPYMYQGASSFREGLAPVCLNGKWGFIDKKNNKVIPFEYDNVVGFGEGLSGVKRKKKWGFIDKSGKLVIPYAAYEGVLFFHEGLAPVARDGKWGFIDKSGKLVIPFAYEYGVGHFNQGLATVSLKGVKGKGYINTKGEMIIPVQFEEAGIFADDGTAKVLKAGVNYYIDKTGEIIDGNALVVKMGSAQAAEIAAKNALELIGRGSFTEALTETEKALKLDANNFTALLARGFIYAAYNKDNTKAIDFYSKAISTNGNDSRPFLFRAYALVDANRLAEAQKDLDKAIALYDKCFDCFMLRASIFEKQEKWTDAKNAASFARFANPYSDYAKSSYEKYKSLAEPKPIASNKTVNTYSQSKSTNPSRTSWLLDDEDEYRENPVYTRKRTNLSQSDMDNIIKSNSSSSSSGESGWDKYFRERERQSNIDYKKKNDGYRGY